MPIHQNNINSYSVITGNFTYSVGGPCSRDIYSSGSFTPNTFNGQTITSISSSYGDEFDAETQTCIPGGAETTIIILGNNLPKTFLKSVNGLYANDATFLSNTTQAVWSWADGLVATTGNVDLIIEY